MRITANSYESHISNSDTEIVMPLPRMWQKSIGEPDINLNVIITKQDICDFIVQNRVLEKRYKTKQRLGYKLMSDSPLFIDNDAEYFIKCFAPACDNRPIIIRCDGKAFKGHTSWIVDMHNLIEVN